jgi:hypothetical protein
MEMQIKFFALAILTSFLASVHAWCQDSGYPQHNKYSFSVFAGELGYDAGIGAELGSPSFSNNKLCVRLKGNIYWLEDYKATYDQWAKYRSINATIVYNFMSMERSRIFIETGPFIILADQCFSKKTSHLGINAAAGLEMFVVNNSSLNMCYYFSLGAAYSSATADILENKPKYGDGFIFNNGFRFYF